MRAVECGAAPLDDAFRSAMDDEALALIRTNTQKGLVLGDEGFALEMEQTLGMRVTPLQRGRRKRGGGLQGAQAALVLDG